MKKIYNNIHTLDIVTNRIVTELFAGNYRSSFHGNGIEIEDIRPYEPGDNAKLIDWTASAKLDDVYVKKFKETRELSTFVVINVSESMLFTSIDDGTRKSDKAIETAAILLFSAIKNDESVGAILFSDKIESFIPPRKGRRHALRILREILTAYQKPKKTNADMVNALEHFNKTIRKHPICFVISDNDTWNERERKALTITNLKNDLVYIHITDPFETKITDNSYIVLGDMKSPKTQEFFLNDKKIKDNYTLLRRKKELKRIQTLRYAQIDSITISTNKDVFPALLTLFKQRQNRR